MIKTLIIALFLVPPMVKAFDLELPKTNVVVTVRMQWSTNAEDWNNEITNSFDDSITMTNVSSQFNGFFTAKITEDLGFFDIYKRWGVTTYYSDEVTGPYVPISTNTFFVNPNIFDGYGTNLSYRPMILITNYATNIWGPDDTNIDNTPPPHP